MSGEQQFRRIQSGVKSFADDMREQGIHVGLGKLGVARCVTCGELWPCAGGRGSVQEQASTEEQK